MVLFKRLTLFAFVAAALLMAGVSYTHGRGAYWILKSGGVWSIHTYGGPTVESLSPLSAAAPAISAASVTDTRALFVADPFIQPWGDGWVMFFEIYDVWSDQGDIGIATSPDASIWRYEGIVLDEPFHLSYPCVFEWQGERYMVPESYQAGAIRLYRAQAFPRQWQHVADLVHGAYADPTLFRHDGRWWMFAAPDQPGDNSSLSLFFSDDLQGPWQEHPQSPVVRDDPSKARPGGRVIEVDGKLIRWGQDCVQRYGHALRGYAITELTTTRYREEPLSNGPGLVGSGQGWNADGMHHLDAHQLDDGSWIAAVDGQREMNWVGIRR